jgi:HEAT repeat protein
MSQVKKIDQINHDLKEIFNYGDLFLRVGLSRRWQEFYWLLVSGVHSFPDYRGIKYESKVEPFDIQNKNCAQKMNFDKEVEILSNDIDGSNRAHVAYLLGESKNPAFVDILCKATKDPDGNVRRMAASALGKIGDKLAIDALICLLYDNKHQVRQYAIKALGDIGDERAVPELMKFKDDPIPYIKKAIDTAIEKTNFTLQTPASSKPERVSANINKVSMSKHDMIGALKKIIIELHHNKETASLGEIITKAAIVGIEKDDVEEAIQILKRTGEIYEIHDEQFRIIE